MITKFQSDINLALTKQGEVWPILFRQAVANDCLEFFEIQQEVCITKGPDFLNHKCILCSFRLEQKWSLNYNILFFSHTQRLINGAIQCLWMRTLTPLISSHNGFIEDVGRSLPANIFFCFTRPTRGQNHKYTEQM